MRDGTRSPLEDDHDEHWIIHDFWSHVGVWDTLSHDVKRDYCDDGEWNAELYSSFGEAESDQTWKPLHPMESSEKSSSKVPDLQPYIRWNRMDFVEVETYILDLSSINTHVHTYILLYVQ
jgi:hypothetical protein